MNFTKSNVQDLKATEVFHQTKDRFQRNVDRIFSIEDDIYLINQENIEIGFFYEVDLPFKHYFKIFIDPVIDKFDITRFKELIFDFIKDNNKEFVEFALLSRSYEFIKNFNRIDAMLQYRVDSFDLKALPAINSEFNVSDHIDDYNKLTDFLYLAFQNDDDYCKADWRSMMKTFTKANFPRISCICRKNNEIAGLCIGYNFIHLKKKYLYAIAVHPKYQRNHIGEHLLRMFLNSKPIIPSYLTVLESAKNARLLYEKVGYYNAKITSVICKKNEL